MANSPDDKIPINERAKLDATGEFFSVGTPLHAVRAGYVRRAADTVLFETISAGRYAHVIAPDRSGKSSLIAATAARLEAHGHKVAILDLEQIGGREAGSDEGRWYYSVAYRLLRQLRIRIDLHSWWQDKSMLSNRQRLVEFYSEIVLQNVQERVAVFVDQIQCVADLGFADQLLASIRAAHNARAADPDFSRITFALLGECDPLSLIDEPEFSPFNITQAVTLGDFSREDLDLFMTELNLNRAQARLALDRVFYWTSGQPYLSQKLARAIAREQIVVEGPQEIAAEVDRVAMQQLAGRSALHNEPHMSHIHREVVKDSKRRELILSLYGRICKKVSLATDLGSPAQRRLIALGLIVIDDEGQLKVRNRLYGSVFTARWANENLPIGWRAPALATLVLLGVLFLPFWYTQLLPKPYVVILTSPTTELAIAENAYENFRTFPGHVDSANNLYRGFLQNRSDASVDFAEIEVLAAMAEKLPNAGNLPAELVAGFWDRKAREAMRMERRDEALLATIESLSLASSARRNRASMLVSNDYPLLLASLPYTGSGVVAFDTENMLLTSIEQAQVLQWSFANKDLQARDPWTITALEVAPLVRRVIVDQEGDVRRVGLILNLSHARVGDLRIKVIAPSGRAVEVEPKVDRASSNQDIRIESSQLHELVGESLNGTWSISVRDEELGVAGQLVGWNLQLNSQGLVEDFQRGLNIADPVERETENIWLSDDGRFAVARATQGDSARVWDLAFAKPVRAVAIAEQEQLIGVSANARQLVTAIQGVVNLWDTATGDRVARLDVGVASSNSTLTGDRSHLLVQRRSDLDARFELWSLDDAAVVATLDVAGTPALVSLDATGRRIAIADFDRAVRVWDFRSGELLAQIDLAAQPSRIELAAGGDVLGVEIGEIGASLWRIDRPTQAVLEEFGRGAWALAFSQSGTKALVGRPEHGFQVYMTNDGALLGPAIGSGADAHAGLGFSFDEQVVVTGGPEQAIRIWETPSATAATQTAGSDFHHIWSPAGDAVAAVTPDATTLVIGDQQGDVHMLAATGAREALLVESEDVSFLGHNRKVRVLAVSPNGSMVASAADDNTIRVWSTASGLPLPYFGSIGGNAPEMIAFSPDATRLGVLSNSQVHVMDTADGAILARLDLSEPHNALAFADSQHLYLGSDSGTLRVLQQNTAEDWGLRTLWQGTVAIRWLEASPQSRFLVVVDQNNLAQQFILAEGRLGESTLQLPGPVDEVRFAPGGSRVLFRTARWVHRASAATSGLHWLDALLAPRSISTGNMVFGAADNSATVASGSRVYLPVASDGYVHLVELNFDSRRGAALFGNKDDLRKHWRHRLGLE